MTTEHLKANIIDCFKKYETEMLLYSVLLNLNVENVHISFEYEGNMVVAVYSNQLRKFIKLVYGSLKIQL